MSLILEALKKSEAKRRLGDAPDLGTPFTAARPRRNWLPLGVIAIAIAAGAGAWLLRQPKTQTLAPNPTVRATAPTAMQTPAKGSTPPIQMATPHVRQKPLVAAPARPAAGTISTPAHSIVAPPTMAAALPVAAVPAPGHAPVPTRAPKPAATTGAMSAPAPTQTAVATPPAASATPPTPALAPAGVPMYYELPFSVRQALPTLKMSMHVYAADPAQRFVILDDSRLHEGEKTADGVLVRSIRPDGVILEFQDQQFFYPRDGF